ncbi:MAG: hypothetical protein Q7K44_03425 [Candidatus Liptonbacteria bacterium]|nr:hypothetical protein [Candidatus Liptonbacteria bacterium]
MDIILKYIFYFVVWVFVPAILITLACLLKLRIDKVEEKRHRSAMQAGYWAGIMLFIIVLIYQVAIFLQIGFPKAEVFQGFSLPLALGSALVVFILFLGGKKIVPVVVSGLIVLVFTFLIFTALLHYLFIRTHNDVLLSMILGGIFGFLTHFAVAPTSLKEFLKGKSL